MSSYESIGQTRANNTLVATFGSPAPIRQKKTHAVSVLLYRSIHIQFADAHPSPRSCEPSWMSALSALVAMPPPRHR